MYRNAEGILPRNLLQEIQKYVEGQEIYIPKRLQARMAWGESNGTRAALAERNQAILRAYLDGDDISQLMAQYHLGYDSIRKILRKTRRERAV
ncbi:MAG: CD3324 family protein [Bacteroidota bacterium]